MSFWISAVVIGGLVALLVGLAMGRGRTGLAAGGHDMQVYRDQLQEVERDLARGVISAEETERVRVEVSRRLLEADRQAQGSGTLVAGGNGGFAGTLVGLALIAGAFFIYGQLGAPNYADLPLKKRIENADGARADRPSQAEVEQNFSAVQIDPSTEPRLLALMEKLRAALVERPDDLQGHILLARNEAALGDFVAAHKAQARVVEIKGGEASAEDYAVYADLLITAAGGYVSPEAETALTRTLQRDPENGTARYYSGLMYAQGDRADLGLHIWRGLLETSAPQDPWVAPIRDQIEAVAAAAGVRYELPDDGRLRGPDAADIAAAADMSEEDRDAMIRSMVEGLSERLASDGGPPEDWARLIGALGVLGEADRAAAIWGEAQQVFGADAGALATVRAAAERAGVAE